MSNKLPLLYLLAMVITLSGCSRYLPQQAYFTSPFNGYANNYQALPQVRDSAHTAVYGHAGFLTGTANIKSRDDVSAFRGSVTVAHHGRFWQAYYGGDLTLGSYNMGKWDSGGYTGSTPYPQVAPPHYSVGILNSYAGSHFFGGAGFHGGVNMVMPFRDGEWRILGLETSLYREFGDYLSVRRQLSDTAATLIARNPFYGTLGLGSELVGSTFHGEFGFRMSLGRVLGYPYWKPDIYDNDSHSYLHYWYLTLSSHYTYERYTGYAQLNFAAKAFSLGFGLHYRLTRPRNAPQSPLHRRQYLYQN